MAYIPSDWHIHSVASYDAQLHTGKLVERAKELGLVAYGTTDHVNLPSWIHYLRASRELHKQFARPEFHFGVELTTISGYLEAYDRLHGSAEGYAHPGTDGPDPIAFPLTREELEESGVEYVIGAGHWILNAPRTQDGIVKEMHRQHLYCACSPLVDIVGHPYCFYGTYENRQGVQVPFDDFSIVPRSVHEELYAALLENGKRMEINLSFFSDKRTEKWKHDYAEFARGAFERGIPVTIGSDCHGPDYPDQNERCRKYLGEVGFVTEDFSSPEFRRRF